MTVKKPAPVTQPVPNPLHNFASYTYAISLWWLDIKDYTALAQCPDVDQALAMTFPNSYVLAEDSGLYPNQRLPGTGGLNYYLSNLRLTTHVQPGPHQGQSNMFKAKFTITEPYGSTLLNSMVSYSQIQNQGSYIDQRYIIQIDFFGYDDTGTMIPASQTSLFRKRFPVTISEMKMNITSAGSKYECTALPAGFEVKLATNCKLPTSMQVTAGTFKELLDGVASEYNKYWLNEVKVGHRSLANTLKFDIDEDIAASTLTRPDTTPISQVDPNSNDAALGKVPFNFTKDEDIDSIVQRAFSQSSFFVRDQLGLGPPNPNAKQNNLATILNTYKTTCVAIPQGVAGNGTVCTAENSQDVQRNKLAYSFGINIHQYATFGGPHPLDSGPFADTRPHTVKFYNYTYTGENIDITDLKIDFNFKYYTAVIVGADSINAAQVTSNSANQTKAQYAASSGFGATPNFYMNTILPQFQAAQILAPIRIESIINDASVSAGLRNQSDAIIAADVLKAKQEANGADMLTVKLSIVGDPTLLKQDDWLYSPSPTQSTNYNNWDTMGNYEFYLKYGHLRMDVGKLVIGLQINTPIDIDTDYLNTGLVFPPMVRNGTSASLFSGQYSINTIDSTFDKGQFSQELHLVRFFNQEQIALSSPDTTTDPVSKSQNNMRQSTTTNTTTLVSPVTTAAGTVSYDAMGNVTGTDNARQ